MFKKRDDKDIPEDEDFAMVLVTDDDITIFGNALTEFEGEISRKILGKVKTREEFEKVLKENFEKRED